MLFSTAGIEVAFWVPPLVAFAVSFFTSMGGVSGAFLLLPFQMSFLGYTNPSVSATNQVFNIVAIPSGVYRYWRENRMVWPLTWTVTAGTLPGVFMGAILRVHCLPDPKNFKLFASGVLLYIAGKMILDAWGGEKKDVSAVNEDIGREIADTGRTRTTHCSVRRLAYTYQGRTYDVSLWAVFSLSLIVGVVGGVYGIGGGSIIAPFFITFLGLPVYTVAGAALMGTFVTSIAGVAFYQAMAPLYPHLSVAPDWTLGLLFGLGGMAGMYLGARCQRFVPSRIIKWMLAVIMVFTAMKYVFEFFAS
jgi:hypothetical protein